MSGVSIFTPENRLAKVLNALEGPTSEELVAEAEARVTAMGDAIRVYVAAKLEEIFILGAKGDDDLFAESRKLGDVALAVAEVAGAAGQVTIGEVARGISSMIVGLVTSGVWHSEALRLHINTLRLLDPTSLGDGDEDVLILRKLQALREALGLAD